MRFRTSRQVDPAKHANHEIALHCKVVAATQKFYTRGIHSRYIITALDPSDDAVYIVAKNIHQEKARATIADSKSRAPKQLLHLQLVTHCVPQNWTHKEATSRREVHLVSYLRVTSKHQKHPAADSPKPGNLEGLQGLPLAPSLSFTSS